MSQVELLAPAGDRSKLEVAILYGADAVYLSGPAYGLRAATTRFTLDELARAVEFVRARQRKIYVTVNILAHEEDLVDLPDYLRHLKELQVDGIIVADPGILSIARAVTPELPVHLSTQANTTNSAAARFWAEQGVSRIILARELSLSEINAIRAAVPGIELEVFIHGAMCLAYSGRCLLSAYMTGRDANRGQCAHPCRYRYALVEEKRPTQFYPLMEEERGTYILSSYDLCLLDYLPQLLAAGVNSLKIEGRMKSLHYLATTVKVYREALDALQEEKEKYFFCQSFWREELLKATTRWFTAGFLPGTGRIVQPLSWSQIELPVATFAGVVYDYDRERDLHLVEQRNKFSCGDEMEILQPQGKNIRFRPQEIYNMEGNPIISCPHPQERVWMKLPVQVPPYSLLRVLAKSTR